MFFAVLCAVCSQLRTVGSMSLIIHCSNTLAYSWHHVILLKNHYSYTSFFFNFHLTSVHLLRHTACTTRHYFDAIFADVFDFVVHDSLSLGAGHTLMQRNGTVWAAGVNMFGQLGIDLKTNIMKPNFVELFSGGAKAVAAGGGHSIVLKQDGSVWSTGRNMYGQLGDGSMVSKSTFSMVLSAVHGA